MSKKRASNYEKKVQVTGSFEDVVKASVTNIDVKKETKKQPKKVAKKK